MRNFGKWFAPVLVSAVCLGGVAFAYGTPDNIFDKPVKTVKLPLPHDPDNPQAKAELTCAYYKNFMVKQVDMGEEGADQLSIIPTAGQMPACVRKNAANEKVVASDDWSGYFAGVKGDYVFFDAGDGWNNGMGFAVFTADAKKIFEDVAIKWHSADITPTGLALHYDRVYGAKCSLMSGTTCWAQIKTDTGLTDATAPDCKAAYAREQKRTPKENIFTDPTVVDYEVTNTVTGHASKIVATGHAIGCRPAE